MSNTVHGGSAPKKTKRVFYRTGTASEGHAVCYNWDAVGVDAENNSFTTQYGRSLGTTVQEWCDARRVMVEDPSEENNLHFAGVIDGASDGVIGPNWIEINEPGSVCNIFSSLSAAHAPAGVTRSYPGDPIDSSRNYGGMLTFNVATGTAIDNGEFKYSGYPGKGSAMCLQVASDADVLVMAELMDGEQSGGVQCLPMGTASDFSAGITIMQGGVTLITAKTCAASGVCSATISAGAYPGMKKRIGAAGAASDLAVLISVAIAGGVLTPFTTGHAALDASMFISGDRINFASLSNPDASWIDLVWTGTQWENTGNGALVIVT